MLKLIKWDLDLSVDATPKKLSVLIDKVYEFSQVGTIGEVASFALIHDWGEKG